MRRAILTQEARRDLAEAMRWTARERPQAAQRLKTAVGSLSRLFAEQPFIGTERPELVGSPFRFMPVQGFNYLMVYDASRTPPVIVRVVHSARDLPQLLADLRSEGPSPVESGRGRG